MHYNYFRTYDPSTGRYLESDPIGLAAGPNTYSYVSNMPMMRTDRFGLFEITGDPTVEQRRLIQDAADAFIAGLPDVACKSAADEIKRIYDNLEVFVDPLIDSPRRERGRFSRSIFEDQSIQFNSSFFWAADDFGRVQRFAHEVRHLMLVNHVLTPKGFSTTLFLGDLNAEKYRKTPYEKDARAFSEIYTADACFCGDEAMGQ